MSAPTGIALDSAGNIYISDFNNNRIRMISNGVITTLAGTGTAGYSGDGGAATSAQLSNPLGIAVDSGGNIYFADKGNMVIRKISHGTIATVAGNGTQGFSGDGGPATSAELYFPSGVAVDASGRVYFDDEDNNRIRLLTTGSGVGTTPQTVTFGPLSAAILGFAPFTIGATASSGLAVSFASNTTAVCTVSGSTVTAAAAGTCSITASQPGNSTYSAATPVTQTFPVVSNLISNGSFEIPSVSGGLSYLDIGAGSPPAGFAWQVTSGSVDIVAAPSAFASVAFDGTQFLDLDGFNPGIIAQTFATTPGAAYVLNFAYANNFDSTHGATVPATATVSVLDASSKAALITPFQVTHGDTTGANPDWKTSGAVSFVARGSTTSLSFVSNDPASSNGGILLDAVSVTACMSGCQSQTISFGAPGNQVLGAAPIALSATASSGLTVTYVSNTTSICTVSGSVVTLLAAGTCSLTASQAGNSTYAAAMPVTQSFTITIASQTITFGPLSSVTLGAAPFTISATASSGLTVSFASNTTAVCMVSGTTVKVVAAGTCSITASQAGNSEYAAATPVTQSFTVASAKGPLQIPGGGGASQVTLSSGTVSLPYSQLLPVSNGTPPYAWSVLGGNLPKGLSLSGSGTLSGTPTQAGSFPFTAMVTDGSGATASSGFVVGVSPQPLTITTASTLPNGIVGSDYPAQMVAVSGGNAPYTFVQSAGALPGGLSFAGGQISGIPTASGASTFTVTATDSSVPALTASAQLQVTVEPAHADLILSRASVAFSLKAGAAGLPPGTTVGVQSSVVAQLLNYTVSVSPSTPWLDVTGGGTTPGIIGINLDPSALTLGGGALETSVLVTCIAPSPCAGNSQSINVYLTVAAAPPQPAVSTSLLSFSAQSSNAQSMSQTLGLQNVGGGNITVNSVTAADSFVTVSGIPATLAPGPAIPVTVTVNPASLKAGYYQSTISVNTSAGSINTPVTVMLAENPTMTLMPSGMQFQQTTGSSPGNPGGSFLVGVSGNFGVNWNAAVLPGASWLTLNTASGIATAASPGMVSFSINPAVAATLAAQAYYGTIQVTSSSVADSPQSFLVVLNVAVSGAPAQADVEPAGLLFTASGGTAPAAQTVQIFASSPTPVAYQASSDSAWLSVNPASGSTSTASPGSSSVSVNLLGLSSGIYRGQVSYALASAGVHTINVTLIVAGGTGATADENSGAQPRATTCSPTQLVPTQTGLVNNFARPAAWPTPLQVMLVDNCGNAVTNGQVVASFNNGDQPLVSTAASTTSGTYSSTWTPGGTSPNVAILASATAPGFPAATVLIGGQVTSNNGAPSLPLNGTLNVFSTVLLPGSPVAPGTIVQIYGSNLASGTAAASAIPLPNILLQTSVNIGGLAAPLYFVSPGQINAQVPFELAAGRSYGLIVSNNGAFTAARPIQLTSDAPVIAQYAAGQVIGQHLDGSLILETSPAAPGEIIVIYVAGMGLTNPSVASGTASPSTNLATPIDAPTLTLNGAPAPNILFAGLTPTLVGLYQIDLQVPASAPNGDLQLVLTQTSGQSTSTVLPVHN